MVQQDRCVDMDESIAQIVPSAGFTPPCDYSSFADTFDLSLLPLLSPSTCQENIQQAIAKPSNNYYSKSPEEEYCETPDFQKLMEKTPQVSSTLSNIYLEVPCSNKYYPNSPASTLYSPQLLSPNNGAYSPELSLYSGDYYSTTIKQEVGHFDGSVKETSENVFEMLGNSLLDKPCIKEEKEADIYTNLLQIGDAPSPVNQCVEEKKDHQFLREVLRDTSFQRKYNIKPLDFPSIGMDINNIKTESKAQDEYDELSQESIEPVLNLAIEQVRKDVCKTCNTLSISPDPSKWSLENVLSWLEFTSREFDIPQISSEQWNLDGATLVCLSEDDFIKRCSQGGSILYAQLEIWKAAFAQNNMDMKWYPENSLSSPMDVTDDEDEETPSPVSNETKSNEGINTPPRTTGGSHIHLWQFLKELLSSPQAHGSCIRWMDRSKGVFKIEDSVKVARLWGKRKNRPAMNYDKLSRSIRQYYKKGIMKKTERSQRLVYQFCHPYCL